MTETHCAIGRVHLKPMLPRRLPDDGHPMPIGRDNYGRFGRSLYHIEDMPAGTVYDNRHGYVFQVVEDHVMCLWAPPGHLPPATVPIPHRSFLGSPIRMPG